MKTQSYILHITVSILEKLKEFEPFIFSRNVNSVYIHFNNLPLGITHKMRISNHPEREKYGYKWQLRTDGIPKKEHQKKYSLYFNNEHSICNAFKKYYSSFSKPLSKHDN